MWLAPIPPCSCGQPSVNQPFRASFLWKSRKRSQRSSDPSPSAPATAPPAISSDISARRNSRISWRNASSSGENRNSMTSSVERRQVYTMSVQPSANPNMRGFLASVFLLSLALAGCSEDGANTSRSPTSSPAPSPATTASPTPSPTRIPSLTLADIFPPRDLSALKLDPSRVRTLIATGDVIPARYTDVTIRNQGDDFLYTVAATKEITANADLTVINLEAPLLDNCPYHDSGFTFCGRPGFVAALQAAGVDVATLENNHIGNYGVSGIDETAQHLEAGGIRLAERNTPAIIDVRTLKFGFLAFNGVGERIDRQAMTDQIRALRSSVDVVVASFHWGAEYVSLPQTAPGIAEDNPVEIAHLAVDSGADLIIGNHPHWVQGLELYKGK